MSHPKFTFCIPNLNKMRYLPACIESMLAQDDPSWRCVFVDGYSTDGSWEYVQKFATDPRFILMRGRQQGMYEDWNECLKYVETEYFYFLPSDDTCFPDLVSTTTTALDTYSDIDVCHFKFVRIDKEGKRIGTPEDALKLSLIYSECSQYVHRRSGLCEFMMHFAYRALYQTMTSLVFRRNLISKLNGFSSDYGSSGDVDWTIRLGLHSDVLYIPKLLATWRVYEEQATQQMSSIDRQMRFLRIVQSNLDSFISSPYSKTIKSKINRKKILSSFQEAYASAIYETILSAKGVIERNKYIYLLINSAPEYIAKKILNHLSRGTLYRYRNWNEIALDLIHDYELIWPPTPVELNLTKPVISTSQ